MSPPLRRRGWAVVLLAFAGACRCSKPPAAGPGEDLVQPVYAGAVSSPDPRARRLCEALHLLPEQRRGACCGGAARRTLGDECTRVLSLALEGGSVELDGARTEGCIAADEAALQGCGWVGPASVPLPEACQGITLGKRDRGAPCRSALECRDGLRCRGLGPTQAGVCDSPGAPATACELGADPLAVYLLQDGRSHPECSGACVRRTCVPSTGVGEACSFNAQCGPRAHCAAGRCTPGRFARPGEPCVVGACEPDASCRDGTCARRKAEGESCQEDLECVGACLPPDGGVGGACGMRCPQ